MMSHEQRQKWRDPLKRGRGALWLLIALSLLLHVGTLDELGELEIPSWDSPKPSSEPVSIRIHDSTTVERSIVEAPQDETAPPKEPEKARLGVVDHATERETRPKERTPKQPGMDAGVNAHAAQRRAQARSSAAENERKSGAKTATQPKLSIAAEGGTIKMPGGPPRTAYESLLAQSAQNMGGEVSAGYQDFIDDEIDEGATVDLNTQEYRYIGYFTMLRKSIELAWNYPARALRRGIYGNVFLKFTIRRDGRVSRVAVLDSSGHRILDDAIVDAIRVAAPFAPLPESFGEKLSIKGTFRYILN